MYFKIQEAMFKYLVAGKEVIIEQSDGSKLHFILEDMGWDNMYKAINDAQKEQHAQRSNQSGMGTEPF